ncbi:MAG: hypothetical protein ACK52I_12900, partial [Pseudomonadota bacterium]
MCAKQGPAAILELVPHLRGRPYDPTFALATVARKMMVARDVLFKEVVHWGETPPEGARPVAALRFYNIEGGHWTALTRIGAKWREHDDVQTALGTALPKADLYLWLAPRPGAGRPRQCVECTKRAGAHRLKIERRCACCGRSVFGACVPVARRREPAADDEPFRCRVCTTKRIRRVRIADIPVTRVATCPRGDSDDESSDGESASSDSDTEGRSEDDGDDDEDGGDLPAAAAAARAAAPAPAMPRAAREPRAPRVAGAEAAAGPAPTALAVVGHVPPAQLSARDTVQRFGGGQVPPLDLAELRGDLIAKMALLPVKAHPPLVWQALAEAVRARHRSWLTRLKASLLPEHHTQPLPSVVLDIVSRYAKANRWQPQTLNRELGSVTGAFSNLPLYTTYVKAVPLRHCPVWAAALTTAGKDAKVAQPINQPAASQEEIATAVANCASSDPLTAMALMLQWVTCARPNCILALRRHNLSLLPSGRLSVSFTKGKSVEFRGPYTVTTRVPEAWIPTLHAFLAKLRPADLLFPLTASEKRGTRERLMLAALRRVNAGLNLRSMRRGSLQTLAATGVEPKELMKFSAHKSEATLN